MANHYNFIFNQLVQDDSDFVGMVAYTLYKRQKIEWIEKFQSDNGGREPDESDLDQFHRISTMPSQLNVYREQAIDLLDEFLEFALGDKVEQIRQNIQQDALMQAQEKHHARIVLAVDKPLSKVVWENVIAGALASMLTLAAAGLFWLASKGPETLMREAIQNVMASPPHEASASTAQTKQAER